jgi:hypothetical protein
MALTVVCWLWGDKYTDEHVTRMASMAARHLPPHRFVCIADRGIDGVDTLIYKGRVFPRSAGYGVSGNCLRRLWLFSPEAREILGDEILQIDLDMILLAPVEMPAEPFKIWKCPSKGVRKFAYNPSFMYVRGDAIPGLWENFLAFPRRTWLKARRAGWTGNDQAVICHAVQDMNVPVWDEADGFYSFRDHGCELQPGAKIVGFYDAFDPASETALPWVAENWR